MNEDAGAGRADDVTLPRPRHEGTVSLERTLATRRSVREFTGQALRLEAVSQLAWSAMGVSDAEGLRTAPSAGALYPLELFVVTAEGCYRYDAGRHLLVHHIGRDLRAGLFRAALSQPFMRQAGALFVFAAVPRRTEVKYGPDLAPRYVDMEIGHAAQNMLLQAVALGLGAVPVGAFHEDRVRDLMCLTEGHEPLYIVAVGRVP